MPPLERISFRIKSIQRPVPHLDTLRIDLFALVDEFKSVMPSISNIFAVGLRLAGPREAELLVSTCLDNVNQRSPYTPVWESITARAMLSLPANLRHIANTAALSVACEAPCALVGR